MTIDLKDKLYTSTQVADILGVSLRTLYRYMEDGKIESMRTASGRHRFTRNNILDFLNGDKGVQMSDIINPVSGNYSQNPRQDYDGQFNQPRYSNQQNIQANYNNNEGPFFNQMGRNPVPPQRATFNEDIHKQTEYVPKNNPEYQDNFNYNRNPNIKEKPQEERTYINKTNFDFLDDDFLAPTVKTNYQDDVVSPRKTPEPFTVSPQDEKQIKQMDHDYSSHINPQVARSSLNVEYFGSSIQDLVELAKLIKQNAAEFNLRYAFTAYAGASLHFLIPPFTVLHFYIDPYDYNFWVKTLGLKRASMSDSNIGLVQNKSFKFNDLKNIGGFYVVDDNQLRSDLIDLQEHEIAGRLPK